LGAQLFHRDSLCHTESVHQMVHRSRCS
jgi:hypothetical protein